MNCIILAGGKSLRFGDDKPFAKIGNSTLIEHIIAVLSPLFKDLILVTNYPKKYAGFPVYAIEDKIKNIGPLGGIYTGLLASDSYHNFIVACDMPLLNPSLISHMISLIKNDADVIIPNINNKLEPLHAIYGKKCIKAIESQISTGNYKIQDFYCFVNIMHIEEAQLRIFDPGLLSFLNINLQQDLAKIGNCLAIQSNTSAILRQAHHDI